MKKILRSIDASFNAQWKILGRNSRIDYPLYSELGIEYQKEYLAETTFEDFSFLLQEGDVPVVGVIVSSRIDEEGQRELSGFGRPIYAIENRMCAQGVLEKAQSLLLKEFETVLTMVRPERIIFEELDSSLSSLGRYLVEKGGHEVPRYVHVIDLSKTEQQLKHDLRHSYRSLINWGLKNLRMEIVEADNADVQKMEAFRKLHIDVAGRETRSEKTWECQYEMIRHREAFAVLGYLGGELVTAALFVHSPSYCVYGVAASNRDLFEKPLGHGILWTAILHAKKIGCLSLETGEQYSEGHEPTPTKKDLGIATFKRGFGGETHTRTKIIVEEPLV